ncbi:TonB-dependent receptor [Rhodocytophaga aerolata]|uniref:TonB-dependent receptor n=1 Tax=Rhodocytophaga aerolata TaxID=455078 RepID=A0ABT8R683_9BACT|nr:TonB-dependent receptor [Rhodocytophaga aerolata]MDO1446783.1 TonB-dependent receptor [Rhodocytophaga aerolata]
MRTLKILIGLLLCLFGKVWAQNPTQALTQTIRGTVVDKESQTPVIGASVIISSIDPVKGSSTDSHGNFRIEGVPVGRHTIKITSIGYEEQVIPEMLVGSGKEVIMNVRMTESLIQMNEIVVVAAEQEKGKPINDMATLSARSISVEETKRYAASINDPARAALSFAGVSSTDDVGNEIVIRGNSPKGLLWRLEGVEIPNPNHFAEEGSAGGAVSILSVNMLDNSDFFTGAFPAEYGNALSGVFDIKLRRGNNEKREYAFQAGLLGVDFAVEGPFSKNSKASYLANYRYSTLSILDNIGIKVAGTSIPKFQDFSFKVHLPTSKAGNFSVWGLGGLSSQQRAVDKDSTAWESKYDRHQDAFSVSMGAFGLTHTYFLDEKTFFESVLSFSGNRNKYTRDTLNDEYTPVFDYQDNFTNTAIRGSVMVNRKFNSRHTLRTGIIFSHLSFDLFSEGRDRDLGNQVVRFVENKGSSQLFQSYAQWKYRIAQNLTLNTGLHYLQLALNGSKSLEPRAGLKWDFSPRQSVGVGVGVHSRQEAMSTYFAQHRLSDGTYVTPNRNLGFTKASHAVVSYENQLKEDLRLKTEVYYQWLNQVPIRTDPASTMAIINREDGFVTDSLVNKGTGRNYGLELTLEKFFTNNYYFLATTSLYDSKYKPANGREYNTRFNGNFVANVTAGKEIKVGRSKTNLIGLNTRIIWAGGKRYTPINLAASRVKGEAVYYEDQAFGEQASNYYRADIRLSYRKNNPKASHILSLDIQNVTNRLNVYGKYYDEDKGEIATSYQTGLIPILNYRIEF